MKIKQAMNKQLQFYQENNINAVEYGPRLTLHWNQRRNLIEHHLGIPLSLLSSKKVLEFGPCGGENALFLAINGAAVTLVEPNPDMHDSIRKLFKGTGLSEIIGDYTGGGLIALHGATIESFESNEKFDLVIAEGFLHALSNRKEIFKKLFSFSQGLSIITYSCSYGYFFESLKRYIFRRCCESVNENNYKQLDSQNIQMNVAKKLFYEDFKKLHSARTFESWAHDIIMNPAGNATILDDFDDLYRYFVDLGLDVYGCSPRWDMRNQHHWYKDVSDRSIVDEWRENFSFIITGKKGVNLNPQDIEILRKITPLLLDYSSGVEVESPLGIAKFATELSPDFDDIKSVLTEATDRDSERIISAYIGGPNCRNWGMPHHYLALSKEKMSYSL